MAVSMFCSRGVTLVELMIAMMVSAIVLTGIVKMFTSSGNHHLAEEMSTTLSQNIRAARHLMVDELRSAGCNPHDRVRLGFQVSRGGNDRYDTDDNSVHFTRDIDGDEADCEYTPDGSAQNSNEDVSYFRKDAKGNVLNPGDDTVGSLVRDTGGGGQPIVDDIIDLRFSYFDAHGNDITGSLHREHDLDKIRSVQVDITGQVEYPSRVKSDRQTWSQSFRVRVRNL